MGIFDRFRREPPPSGSSAPPPAPGPGEIVSFDPSDGIGRIRQTSGVELRFGRSACRGFEPIASAKVVVRAIEAHPLGGWRATEVTLAGGEQARVDAMLDARDRAGAGEMPFGAAVATASSIGSITVLLRDVPEPGRSGAKALLRAAAQSLGMTLEFAPAPQLTTARGTLIQVAIGHAPFPRGDMDLHRVGADFDPGAAFVTLAYGLPGFTLRARAIVGGALPDPWAPGGDLRALTAVAAQLVEEHGVGVVVHRAGNVAFGAEGWLAKLGPLEDAAARPFGAWIDLGLRQGMLTSYGMEILELPDVAISIGSLGLADGDEAYQRAHEAVLLACYRMTRENRVLQEGEELVVPLGLRVGALPLEVDNPQMTEAFAPRVRVCEVEGRLELHVPMPSRPLAEVWRSTAARGEMPHGAYRDLFLRRVVAKNWVQVGMMCSDRPFPIDVFVYDTGDGFVLLTCGAGRLPQRHGEQAEDSAHLEFILKLGTHSPDIAASLGYLGHTVHLRGEDAAAWGPLHRVRFDPTERPLQVDSLVFAWGGKIELSPGPAVSLLVPLRTTEAERLAVPIAGVGAWAAEHGAAVVKRWEGFAREA
jgi:hypothetical protein